jgi:sulfite reductase (NADPH) flavoprotein alpha-component
MTAKIPVIPADAPFSDRQRFWLNGYLAGLFSVRESIPPAAGPSMGSLLFLYGSQTGSAEMLARDFAKRAAKSGFNTAVHEMDDWTKGDFENAKRVVIITSTYGEGEMPDNAQAFWKFLTGADRPNLENHRFAVLALGDHSYAKFCEAGKMLDTHLGELGATRILPRIDCDVDYEEVAEAWFENLLGVFGENTAAQNASEPVSDKPTFHKKNPFPAALKTNRILNSSQASKDTRHIEILLGDSGLSYQAGDALGVMPRNCPDFVDEILGSTGLSPDEIVEPANAGTMPLREALIRCYDLQPYLKELPAPQHSSFDWLEGLRRLQPRLYSISSSPLAHPGEVHLTVGVVRYELNERKRKGTCSTFLADFSERAANPAVVPIFVHHSPNFKLPTDFSRDIIMVGPGTGIAPFRGFLHERRATAATGRNWLFFGDQRVANDFLYQDDLESLAADGYLHQLDLAFSRDQEEKIYVQHRMLAQAKELYQWLENGAIFYVCGDASRMAADVDQALHQIACLAGGLDETAGAAWVSALKSEKRYLRDVY